MMAGRMCDIGLKAAKCIESPGKAIVRSILWVVSDLLAANPRKVVPPYLCEAVALPTRRSGTHECRPKALHQPESLEELESLVADYHKRGAP